MITEDRISKSHKMFDSDIDGSVPCKRATIFIPKEKHPGQRNLDQIVFCKGCHYAEVVYDFERNGDVITVDGPHDIVEPIIHELMGLVMV